MEIATRTWDFILDRTPGELLGAIMAALTLAVIGSGLHALGRRKVADPSMLTIGVILASALVSMVLAIGFVAHATDAIGGPPTTMIKGGPIVSSPMPPPGDFRPFGFVGAIVFGAADANGDGRLATNEMADAIDLFLQEVDPDEDGSIEMDALQGAIHNRMGPRTSHGDHAGPSRGDRLAVLIDTDHDGQIAPEEAARFVREADAGGKGYADAEDLDAAMRDHIAPTPRYHTPIPLH